MFVIKTKKVNYYKSINLAFLRQCNQAIRMRSKSAAEKVTSNDERRKLLFERQTDCEARSERRKTVTVTTVERSDNLERCT
jgi:hypothetical protein